MAERRDISDALRDAVERTVRATTDTRELAQGAASELSASVDDIVKGAEKGLTRSRRSVRAALGERLPATQDDVAAIRAEVRMIGRRLDAIEARLPHEPAGKGARGAAGKARPARKAKAAGKAKPAGKAKAAGKAKPAGKAKAAKRAGAKPRG